MTRRSALLFASWIVLIGCDDTVEQPSASDAGLDQHDTDVVESDCLATPISECENDPNCAFTNAQKFNPDTACFEEFVVVGCAPRDQICGNNLVQAQNSDGLCVLFTNNCLTPGFSRTDCGLMPGCEP